MATNEDLTIFQKDTEVWEVTVYNKDDEIVNLSGYTMTITVKEDINDDDGDALIDVDAVIAVPADGKGTITLTPTHTDLSCGKYSYDIKVYTDSTNVQTIIYGIFIVSRAVRRSIN